MNAKSIKGDIFTILTLFLLTFVAGGIGNEFVNHRLSSAIILGLILISLSLGSFVAMCLMIREVFQEIDKLGDETFHCWDALQDQKMQNIHNLKDVHEVNIKFYESKIAEYEKNINEINSNSKSKVELAYHEGHIAVLQMLITQSKFQLEQLLLS